MVAIAPESIQFVDVPTDGRAETAAEKLAYPMTTVRPRQFSDALCVHLLVGKASQT